MATDVVADLVVPHRRPEGSKTVIAFRLNGQTFPVHTLKMSMAMNFVSLLESEEESSTKYAMQIASVLYGIIPYIVEIPGYEPEYLVDDDGETVLDPHTGKPVNNPNAGKLMGRARINARLKDPLDPFDIVDLKDVVAETIKAMYGDRPTGPSPESSERRSDDGAESPEASPGEPVKTSGNSRPKRSSGSSKNR